MEAVSLLVKPTCDCNLNCKYCYDVPMRNKYAGQRMSLETIDEIIRLAKTNTKHIKWLWHGGEFGLMGADWIMEVQEHFYSNYDCTFEQTLQSNGTLWGTDEMLKVLKKSGIDIGISYDLLSTDMRGQCDKVRENILMLQKEGLGAGGICVISNENSSRMFEAYLEAQKIYKGKTASFSSMYSVPDRKTLSPEYKELAGHWGDYITKWAYFKEDKLYGERTVNNGINRLVSKRSSLCGETDCRYKWLGFYPNGDIYHCDLPMDERFCFGNVRDFKTMEEVFASDKYIAFVDEIEKRYENFCRPCPAFEMCESRCNGNNSMGCGGRLDIVDEDLCNLKRDKVVLMYNLLKSIDFKNEDVMCSLNPTLVGLVRGNRYINVVDLFPELGNEPIETLDCDEFKLFCEFNHIRKNSYWAEEPKMLSSEYKQYVRDLKRMIREDTIHEFLNNNKMGCGCC